ncbi:MAG TPA: redoxin domain-containing protein [Phycisphaerales bacterium]|nr:redoxin domain-containing protein [Phycisphaerales bacterium]
MRRRSERILVGAYVAAWSALALGGAWAQQNVWPVAQPEPPAEPGAAPEFTLKDLEGAETSLAGLRAEGRIVVLEWFDPRCDWVETYHQASATIKDVRAEFPAVRWAAIYSSIPPEGADAAALNRQAKKEWAIEYPILLDPGAKVAAQYGAERAPFVVVISGAGRVIYKGPIDDSAAPGEPGAQNYLRSALRAATRGETPAVTSAAAPGCRLRAPEETTTEGRA